MCYKGSVHILFDIQFKLRTTTSEARLFNEYYMSTQKKMLIIDDERDFCSLIVLMMQQEPFHIDCAYNLFEAAKLFSSGHPEIILLDHNLPDGTGLDYLDRHRKDFNEAKIILMTADPSLDLKFRAEAAGIEFVAKPFGLKKIKEIIRSVA
jgi:two-component system, OmpR family, response regulator RegX3